MQAAVSMSCGAGSRQFCSAEVRGWLCRELRGETTARKRASICQRLSADSHLIAAPQRQHLRKNSALKLADYVWALLIVRGCCCYSVRS